MLVAVRTHGTAYIKSTASLIHEQRGNDWTVESGDKDPGQIARDVVLGGTGVMMSVCFFEHQTRIPTNDMG